MSKIPFKSIGICSAILTLLVIGRCMVTVGRIRKYGGTQWLEAVQADPWLYVSVAAAALSVICFTMTILQERWNESHRKDDSQEEE